MENFNNVTNFRIVWISNYFIFFLFFQDCHCARPLRIATDRILWPVRSDFSPRRERNGFRLHSQSPLVRNSVEEENIKTPWHGDVRRLSVSRKNYSHVLRSLSLCLYLLLSNRTLLTHTIRYLQYTTKEKRNRYVAMLLSPWFWIVVVVIVLVKYYFYLFIETSSRCYKYWSHKRCSEL